MEKEEFEKTCHDATSSPGQLLERILPLVKRHRHKHNKQKLPVIWIETNDSGDNNISFMNSTFPYLGDIFQNMIDLLYSNTFMAAQGRDAVKLLDLTLERFAGEYTLVVEGAVPLRDNGLYTVIFKTIKGSITALEAVSELGQKAKYVVAAGTCASFGGPTAARPNITGSTSVQNVLQREVINVSGCPVNPDWLIGTLAHLLLFGRPELDELGRPSLFYEFTVHRHCQRRSYFDRNDLADSLGDIRCMFSQGCVGPKTGADCPYRQWDNYVNWPVKANTPCIGCTNPDFPDGSTPFFTPMPQKEESQDGRRKNRDNVQGWRAIQQVKEGRDND
ncbi:MAG: hydrogenase small subunit [Syntrophaceticus sp.]|nr:hydrogenase small subunit [Syntrophaceticus sp.]MDD3314208.1 hydrogenase small subunit [Syntrophaceticus sp.]MDD4360655.1 hydrogenase small subunit [Syntrophaceticus sp.]MDD4783193.1 hydrogenase small subunit [Syntrophaceticus sp.]